MSSATNSVWYVYIIRTDQGKLYTGIATDPDRRFQEHQAAFLKEPKTLASKGAKFFRSQKPVEIVYREQLDNRSEATKREMAIKKMSAVKKKAFIADSHSLPSDS